MKFHIDGFTEIAEKIRSTDVYDVHDFKFLDNIMVSMTQLHPGKATRGHSHKKEEEVYIFLEGSGEMQLGGERFPVRKGDVVLIKGGRFHRVFNPNGPHDLKFLCIFEKYEKRERELREKRRQRTALQEAKTPNLSSAL